MFLFSSTEIIIDELMNIHLKYRIPPITNRQISGFVIEHKIIFIKQG